MANIESHTALEMEKSEMKAFAFELAPALRGNPGYWPKHDRETGGGSH